MSYDGYAKGLEEEKINKHYQSQLANNKKSSQASGSDVKDLQHKAPGGGYSNPSYKGVGPDPNWTMFAEQLSQILEGVNELSEDIASDPLPGTATASEESDDTELVAELNKLFTPVLVMQNFEDGVVDQIKEAYEAADVFTERNIMKFDGETRMSQLIAVCALLISRKRNSPEYNTYKKASEVRNSTRIKIIKDNYEEAKVLAQKYLVNVSTTNNSPIARNAAKDLLPETQH
jgi:hypothetical protein